MSAKTTTERAPDTAAREATKRLNRVRDDLAKAVDATASATERLRQLITDIRPQGLLTVDEMAKAVERDRNYIDSVWSSHGATTKGRQTRVPVTEDASAKEARKAYNVLAQAAAKQRRAMEAEDVARTARNEAVAEVYGSEALGPSGISRSVGIDRNHVLRIARRAGVPPVHRPRSKNQYTSDKSSRQR